MNRGYFGIGIEHGKTKHNIGTLFRSAYNFGADFIFTVGARYNKQSSDTQKTWRHMPLFNFDSIEDLYDHLPYSCKLIGIEQGGISLEKFSHPERCIYLLGAEDHGLTKESSSKCHSVIEIPSFSEQSMNVAVAGSIVLYDRFTK